MVVGGKSNSQVQLLNLHFTFAHTLNDRTKTVRKVILFKHMSAVIAICVTWVQSAVLSSERDSYSYEAKLSVATLEADNDTLHPCQCLHTRVSYDCFAQHTIGLLTR